MPCPIGKTVQTIALCLASPRPANAPGTLVLCPVSLLANWGVREDTALPHPPGRSGHIFLTPWQVELSKCLPAESRHLILDSIGKKKFKTNPDGLADYDIVLSSYSLLKGSPVLQLRWHRLAPDHPWLLFACPRHVRATCPRCVQQVLDESHEGIKNPRSVQSQLVQQIKASRRWCLSGSPCPLGPGDLAGQMSALQMPAYGIPSVFSARLDPLHNGKWVANGRAGSSKCFASEQPLLKFLCSCALRLKKDSVIAEDGQPIVSLPPLTREIRLLDASPTDAASYSRFHAQVRERVETLSRGGSLGVRRGSLASMLLSLRMACDHPSLALAAGERLREQQAQARTAASDAGVRAATPAEVLAEAKGSPKKVEWLEGLLAPYQDTAANGVPECSICLDENLTPALTSCDQPHAFCLSCILECCKQNIYGDHKYRCPLCRTQCALSSLVRLELAAPAADCPMADADADETESAAEMEEEVAARCRSTKLDALVTALREKPEEKSLVFTHFGATQKLVCERLFAEEIAFVKIASNATQPQRAKALHAFTSNPDARVFVLSMRAVRAAAPLSRPCPLRLV